MRSLSGHKITWREALGDRAEPENVRILAVAFWRLLIPLALVLAILSIVFGFLRLQSALGVLDYQPPASSKNASSFDRVKFDAVVGAFDSRLLRYESLKAAPLSADDPSR